jgi:phospholipase C
MNSVDPNHTYESRWLPQYDSGHMDGFCQIQDKNTGKCQQYSYAVKSDVQPYFDVATNYGFANFWCSTKRGICTAPPAAARRTVAHTPAG